MGVRVFLLGCGGCASVSDRTTSTPTPNASGDPGVHMCSFSQYPAIGQRICESFRFAPVCQGLILSTESAYQSYVWLADGTECFTKGNL